MSREEIPARLRENEAALHERGVAQAALFGSRARGDQLPESDTDILIEFDPAARITVFDLCRFEGVHRRAVRRPCERGEPRRVEALREAGSHCGRHLCLLTPRQSLG
jgi:predicted nucleotidyltransferase